ncbi:MAG TPA: DoxX family protein [Gammaproteobacteria bacterium]|jgi:thiosulfate dehydrogenase [quinone] large subunit|nr:DoxX family protein [Gammaproteobacteria bacterium]
MGQSLLNDRVAGWPVAVLRVAMGILWLVAVSGKLSHIGAWPDGLHGYLEASAKTAFGFYQGFLGFASAHYQSFAWLVVIGELCVGLALVLGALSRFAAAVGLFMVLNFWFMKGATFWDPQNHDSLFIIILFALMFTQCGRVLGLDHFLSRRKPALLIW